MKFTYSLLAALSVWLALPLTTLAANGDSCRFVDQAVTAVAPGTTTGQHIPLPTTTVGLATTRSTPMIDCRLVCDVTSATSFTCGPMWVPGGGANLDAAVVRVLAGNVADGCGYDDVNVYELSNTSASPTVTSAEMASIGVLDKDAPTGGTVKQIKNFGPFGPYVYIAGTSTDAGALTCDATHRLQIQLLLYPKHPMQ